MKSIVGHILLILALLVPGGCIPRYTFNGSAINYVIY